MTKKYAIFLDIDGVFTSHRVHMSKRFDRMMWVEFDKVAIEFMNTIHEKHEVDFIIMSTWKNGLNPTDPMLLHWIDCAFVNAGFRGRIHDDWKTNPLNDSSVERLDRGVQVKEWLDKHPEYSDFILFDDTNYSFERILGKKRHIRTDPDNGLLYKHMKNALSLMGNWEKKS